MRIRIIEGWLYFWKFCLSLLIRSYKNRAIISEFKLLMCASNYYTILTRNQIKFKCLKHFSGTRYNFEKYRHGQAGTLGEPYDKKIFYALLKVSNTYIVGEKMSEFYLHSRGKTSSPTGIFATFPRPKFQVRHFSPTKISSSSLFPDQIYNLVTSARLNCPNELVSFTSSK